METDRLVYVYGIVPASHEMAGAPAGVDGHALELVTAGDLAALAGPVDAGTYASESAGERTAELEWLAPRAAAHDAVLTWASDAGPVVPLPLLSIFRSAESVREMLESRGPALRRVLERVGRGREYGVRVFRVDAELERSLGALSERIAALEREVEATPAPGQRYLLGRKLDAARRDETRSAAAAVADRAFDALAAVSLASEQSPVPEPAGDEPGIAVLNASFLVAHEAVDDFRGVVTSLVREYEPRGFRFQFTGPWPPYHFARSDADGG